MSTNSIVLLRVEYTDTLVNQILSLAWFVIYVNVSSITLSIHKCAHMGIFYSQQMIVVVWSMHFNALVSLICRCHFPFITRARFSSFMLDTHFCCKLIYVYLQDSKGFFFDQILLGIEINISLSFYWYFELGSWLLHVLSALVRSRQSPLVSYHRSSHSWLWTFESW